MSELGYRQESYIDDVGRVWVSLAALAAELGTSPSVELRHMLLTRMGYVHVARGARLLHISLNPALVSDASEAALLRLILEEMPGRCTADIYDGQGGVVSKLLPAAPTAIKSLGELIVDARSPNFEVVASQRLNIDDCAGCLQLLAAVDYWKAFGGSHERESFDHLLNDVLEARFVLFEQQRASPDICFKSVGSGLPDFAVSTIQRLIGRRAEQHPDRNYGKACAVAYRDCINAWSPVIELIEAKVFWPKHGRLRRRYSRLLLPFKTDTGSIEVLSATTPVVAPVGLRKVG